MLPNTVSLSTNLCVNSDGGFAQTKKQVSTCPPDTHRSGKATSIKTAILSDMLMWERFREVQNHNGNIYLRNSFRILQGFYTGKIRLSWAGHKLPELNTRVNVIRWVLLGASWSNRFKLFFLIKKHLKDLSQENLIINSHWRCIWNWISVQTFFI